GVCRETVREFNQATDAVRRFGLSEVAASIGAIESTGEAAAGLTETAREAASSSIGDRFGRHSSAVAAIGLAMSGATEQVHDLDNRLMHAFPNDTLMTNVWLPCARGALAINDGRAGDAIGGGRVSAPYALGGAAVYPPA